MPDGQRYLWTARAVTRHRGGWGEPGKTFAIGLGCEIRHAPRLVYSDGLDLDNASAATPIGMGCRLCERLDCPQRAVPPLGRPLPSTRTAAPSSRTRSPAPTPGRSVGGPGVGARRGRERREGPPALRPSSGSGLSQGPVRSGAVACRQLPVTVPRKRMCGRPSGPSRVTRRAPRRRRRSASSVSTSPGVPPATTRPSWRTRRVAVHRGQIEVVQRDHGGDRQPGDQVQQVELVLDVEVVGRARPAAVRVAAWARARAIWARWRSPPERVCQDCAGPVGESGPLQGRADGLLVRGRAARDQARRCGMRPRRTTSRTLSSTWVSACCSTTATAGRRPRVPSPASGRPSRVTTPEAGARTPASSRSSVDLPEPFGPSSPMTVPGRRREAHPVQDQPPARGHALAQAAPVRHRASPVPARPRLLALLRVRYRTRTKAGTPISEVTTPTGTSCGSRTVRARVSTHTRNTARRARSPAAAGCARARPGRGRRAEAPGRRSRSPPPS